MKTMGRPALTRDEFMAKFERNATTGCLEWPGLKGRGGYGRTTIRGKDWYTHRYVWTMFMGKIPEGMLVCHKCDNPKCAELEHLFLGTSLDNAHDKIAKGRASHGEKNGRAKLTEDDVRAIRASNERQVDLAARYGVAQNMISKVKLRQFWKDVA